MLLFLFPLALFAADPAREFDKRIAPILTKRCLPCHNEELKNAGISFQDRATLLIGGPRGPAVVPGKPESSYLVRTIRHNDDVRMPPGPRMPEKEIRALTEWIRRGAEWGRALRK